MEFVILAILVIIAGAVAFPFAKEFILSQQARRNNADQLTGVSDMTHDNTWSPPGKFREPPE